MVLDDVMMSAYGVSVGAVLDVFKCEDSIDCGLAFLSAGKQCREVVAVRQFTIWALRTCFGCSYGEISRKTGISLRNVIHSVVRVKFLSEIDPEYMKVAELIRERASANGE